MFTSEFEKTSKPKWMKNLTWAKNLAETHLLKDPKSVKVKSSPWGSRVANSIKTMSNAKKPNRKRLAEALGIKDAKYMSNVSMQDPVKRATYFKHRGKHYKAIPKSEFMETYKKHPKKAVEEAVKDATGRAKGYLARGKGADEIPSFKEINPKGNINVAHLSMNPRELRKAKNVRSLSNSMHQKPMNNVFAFKSGDKKSMKMFSGPKKVLKEMGGEVVHSKVPKRDITYASQQSDPYNISKAEIVIPGRSFLKGVKK